MIFTVSNPSSYVLTFFFFGGGGGGGKGRLRTIKCTQKSSSAGSTPPTCGRTDVCYGLHLYL